MMPIHPDVDLRPQIQPYAATATMLIKKAGCTALTADVLTSIQREGITNVNFCGLDTESCVMATMLGAFENGLTPWLIKAATDGGLECVEGPDHRIEPRPAGPCASSDDGIMESF